MVASRSTSVVSVMVLPSVGPSLVDGTASLTYGPLSGPTRMMQAIQIFVQNRIISNVLAMQTQPRAPFAVKLLNQYPWLRRLPARLIGMGFRPEHVSPDIRKRKPEIGSQ